MHADGVEQRRVDERDRGDAGAGDANRARRHGYTALVSASDSTSRPAAMIACSCGEVVGGRHDQRRADRSGGDAFERDAGLDEGDGVAGHGVAQAHERVEEGRRQGVHQFIVAGFERVVEGEREVGGEGEGGRRVQRHADGAVGLLGGLGGGQAVEEQEVLADGVGDGADDAGDLVEIAGAVLEADDVGDLRDLDRGLLGVAGVVAVVDDHRQVGGRGDLAGVGDEPGLRHLDEVRAAAAAGRRRRWLWRTGRRAWPGRWSHRRRRRRGRGRRRPRPRCGRRRRTPAARGRGIRLCRRR